MLLLWRWPEALGGNWRRLDGARPLETWMRVPESCQGGPLHPGDADETGNEGAYCDGRIRRYFIIWHQNFLFYFIGLYDCHISILQLSWMTPRAEIIILTWRWIEFPLFGRIKMERFGKKKLNRRRLKCHSSAAGGGLMTRGNNTAEQAVRDPSEQKEVIKSYFNPPHPITRSYKQ